MDLPGTLKTNKPKRLPKSNLKNHTNEIFSALADENRRKILAILSAESKNVGSIAECFKISRPAISKHLRILERSKLVTAKRRGRERFRSR